MKQILHIFRKDSRRLMFEILISLALVATLVITAPRRWEPDAANGLFAVSMGGLTTGTLALAGGILQVLILLGWWALIGQVIHEERLVGDRQFWLTRPYDWRNLLAAKAMFIAAYVYVPLLLAQCIILAEAGFSPVAYLPGIFVNLVGLTLFILPLAVIAALTRNFTRMTMVMLGILVGLVAFLAVAQSLGGSELHSPIEAEVNGFLLVCLCAAAILLQYATRRTVRSWVLLSTILLLSVAVSCIAPDQKMMDRIYPLATVDAGLHPSYRDDTSTQPSAYVARRNSEIGISIPMRVSGVTEGTVPIPQNIKVTLEAAGGARWTSAWQAVSMQKFSSEQRIELANFTMPISIYQKLKGTPLHAHISIALEHAQESRATVINLPLRDFAVADVGTCIAGTAFAPKPGEINGVFCRAPLRQPTLTLVESAWTYDACGTAAPHTVQGSAWIGSVDRSPAEFGLVPLWINRVPLGNQMRDYRTQKEPQHLCPGQPITFTTYALSGRSQVSFDVEHFTLPTLSAAQFAAGEGR